MTPVFTNLSYNIMLSIYNYSVLHYLLIYNFDTQPTYQGYSTTYKMSIFSLLSNENMF